MHERKADYTNTFCHLMNINLKKVELYNDKDFIKFASEFRPLVLTQENKLMTAAPWTPYETT